MANSGLPWGERVVWREDCDLIIAGEHRPQCPRKVKEGNSKMPCREMGKAGCALSSLAGGRGKNGKEKGRKENKTSGSQVVGYLTPRYNQQQRRQQQRR